MAQIHTLYPQKVRLEPTLHEYRDDKGRQYLSVSRLLGLLSERFEDTPAYHRASEETRAEWKAKGEYARNHGTNIHDALEKYSETGIIQPENHHLVGAIKSISSEYNEYHKQYNELCLYNDNYRVAGTTDKLCVISNRKDSEVDLADFKTNVSKGIYYHSEYKKRMYAPLEHLQDCNYVKYSLQLSLYAYFFEELTGRRVRKMWIHFIPPDDMMKHQKIPVVYMKNDVRLLLEKYKDKILSLLEPIQCTQIVDEEEMF